MANSQSTAQSAAERRTAEAELNALVARFAPQHHEVVGTLRSWVRKRLPTAHELVYEYRSWFVISYSPSEHGYEGVLSIRGSADGVKLYLNGGKGLPDPRKLLRGSGSLVRWIDLGGELTLAHPAVALLIDEALARHPVPFEPTGRGSIVLRSASAKTRPRRRPA